MTLVWTETAQAHLEAIRAYIALTSPLYANLTVHRLVRRAGQLRDFPNVGRPVPERPNTDLRELLELSYRIIYRPHADVVTVLAVIHGRRASIGPVE